MTNNWDFRLKIKDWEKPENTDGWCQALLIQTEPGKGLFVTLGVTGYEMKKLGIDHPSKMPRKFALKKARDMAANLLDHIDMTIEEESRNA